MPGDGQQGDNVEGEMSEPICDCCEKTDGGWIQRCDCGNSGDLASAQDWCSRANAADTIESLTAELAALKERYRWIPVGERLPGLEGDPEEWCLVVRDGEVDAEATYRTTRLPVERDGWRWEGYNEDQHSQVTHWMPLPEPPDQP